MMMPEPCLQVGLLVEVVEHDLGFLAALQLENDAHAAAVAFVADVADPLDLLLIDQVGGLLDQARLVHLERDFADDDRVAVFADLLGIGFGADYDMAAAGLVGRQRPGAAAKNAAGRKIRSAHDLDNAFKFGSWDGG